MVRICPRKIPILLALLGLPLFDVPYVAAQHPFEVARVSIGADKRVHVVYRDGKELVAPEEKGQVDRASAKVADDKITVGWLVESDNCCTSYPIPLNLVIYRNGRLIHDFEPGQSIWDWQFLRKGSRVAFRVGPAHGAFTPHFELHDVRSGRLLTEWNGHVNSKDPAWVTGLKE